MNRDVKSLVWGSITLLLGLLGMVLTTSWVWPGITLVLGVIGLTAALVTPARETPGR